MTKRNARRLLARSRALTEDLADYVDSLPADQKKKKAQPGTPGTVDRSPGAPTPPIRDKPGDLGGKDEPAPSTNLAIGISWRARDTSSPQVRWFMDTPKDAVAVDGVEFRCYLRTFPGLDATCVTVAAINGNEDRGCAYFESFKILDGPKTLEAIEGRHVILPRLGIVRRFYIGPEAKQLASWENVDDYRIGPAWGPSRAKIQLKKKGRLVVGPYEFFWKFRSLDNSHGGQGVGPFHGTADDWATFPEGRRLREKEMLGEAQRPFWLLGTMTPQPYWLGQTKEHYPKGFRDEPDDWCSYAKDLAKVRAADHTHWSRSWAAADALATHGDNFARDIMLAHWKDFKLAYDLDRGDSGESPLLTSLKAKIEDADGPTSASYGDRGLAHLLRFVRRMRDYVDPAEIYPYEKALRALVLGLGDKHGVTMARTQGNGWTDEAGLTAPWTYTLHVQLCCHEFAEFGGLGDVASWLRNFLTAAPPKAFEWRDDDAETCLDRGHTEADGYKSYSTMIWGERDSVLRGFDSPKAFLDAMRGRGCNGSSQDLDCVPRSLWEPGV